MRLPMVRVKKKYVFLVVVLYFACATVIATAGGDYLFLQAHRHLERNEYVQTLAYLDQLLEQYPKHNKVPDALYMSAQMLPDHRHFAAVLFADAASISRSTSPADLDMTLTGQRQRLQRLYDEFPDFFLRNQVIHFLALLLHADNDPQAYDMLWEALRLPHGPRMAEAAFALVDRYVAAASPTAALDALDYLAEHHPDHSAPEQYLKRGDVYLSMGDIAAAKEAFAAGMAVQEELLRTLQDRDEHRLTDQDLQLSLQYFQETIASRLQQAAADQKTGWVTGQVTLLDQPLSGITIVAEPVDGSSRFGGAASEFPYYTVTDTDGTYRLAITADENVRVGLYLDQIYAQQVDGTHLHISQPQVNTADGESTVVDFSFRTPVHLDPLPEKWQRSAGPLRLAWSELPEAAAYAVAVYHTSEWEQERSTVNVGRWTTQNPRMEVHPDDVNWPNFGAFSMKRSGVDPVHFLGTWKTGGTFTVNVDALDAAGTTITSTGLQLLEPSQTTFTAIAGDGLTEAEQILSERNYDRAIARLEQQLAVEPQNEELLYTLARVYFSGTQQQADQWRVLKHQDRVRSRELMKQLLSIAPKPAYEEALQVIESALNRR